MSLTLALNTALSGLQVNQAAIQVTSNNITNANTPGYSRKIANLETVGLGNTGAGVNMASVTRQVDSYLSREARSSSSDLTSLTTQNSFYEQMQALFGSPGASSSISSYLDQFESSLQALSTAADDPTLRSQVVGKGVTLARQLNDMSKGVQNLRLQADRDIAQSVKTINDQLGAISNLNGQIVRLKGLGQSTSELEDQRDAALGKLSSEMDISTFVRPGGDMVVLNRSGHVLVDGPPFPLSYTPAANMQASSTYPTNVQGVMLGGVDITQDFKSGRISGLLEVRDSILPTMGAEVSQLAVTLRDTINKVHNLGAGVPAATTLASSRPQTATATMTSDLTIALLNTDGTEYASTTIAAPASLDAAGLKAAIDAATWSPAPPAITPPTVTVSGGGFAIDGGTHGVALSGGTVDLGGGQTTTVSDFFHLNDFFVGDNPSDYAAVIAVRSDIAANSNLLSRGQLRQTTTGGYYVSDGDGAIARQLSDTMAGGTHFTAALGPTGAGLPAMDRSFSDYGAAILSQNATEADSLKTRLDSKQAMTDQLTLKATAFSGVNIDEEMANLVTLQNSYAASAHLITTVTDMFDTLMSLNR
jgi:flagellar hook-associated protein 1 FlgK